MELREALSEAMENMPMGGEESPAPVVIPDEDTETASETAARERDEKGRFATRDSTAQDNPPGAAATPIAAVPAAVEPRKAPSSWKKEMWDHYGKLPPDVQDYIDLRERQAMEGIAPHRQAAEQYRTQAEAAQELRAALQPFEQELSAHNMKPADWIRSLGQAQMVLVKGTPEQKMGMFQNLLKGAFGPSAQVAVQDSAGNWQLAAAQQYQQQQQQPGLTPDDIKRIVREERQQEGVENTLQSFLADVPTKYPHYEALKQSMLGLLQAGLAQDLPGAYASALALPAHAALNSQVQEQNRAAEESRKAADRTAAAAKARANNLSPRSATPTTAGGGGKKGLRAHLEDAFDESVSRV